MIIPIFSILIITSLIFLAKNKFKFEICPICAGVSLTWTWMLIGLYLGKLSTLEYQIPTAILLGGSVVGVMYKLESFIKIKFILIWKTIFVVLGFSAVYSLLFFSGINFVINLFFLFIFTFIFKEYKTEIVEQKRKNIKELEEKMKSCC